MSPAPRTVTDWLRAQKKQVCDGPELPVSAAAAAGVEVEAWLQRHGVQYAPVADIPMTAIDEKRSRANQARKDAIVTESVDRFASALRAGAVFPPIVGYPSGGKIVIIDGNNRQAAHRRVAAPTIRGILISDTTPSELIQLLTVEANAHHGVTPDLSWRVKQAFYLCSLGFNDQAAADAASISITQLRAARSVQEADQRARAMHVAGFDKLAQQSRQSLGTLRDDAVFYQAAKLAAETAMTSDEIRALVREVKTLPSEPARIEYIGKVAKERGIERATRKALGKAMSRVSSPKQSLVAGIGKVMNVDAAALVRQVLTTRDRDLLRSRLQQLQLKLAEIEVAMSTLNDLDSED